MNLTFVVPQGAEANAVRRAVPHARIVATAAGAAAAAALPPFPADAGVVVLGLCGALRSRTVGDVIVYREIAAGTGTVPLEHTFADALAAALPHAYGARGCSADHVITRRAEREAYAARYDADVVDMEGAALAAALGERGVRFGMVRVVSDDARCDLPAMENVIRPDGRLDVARLAAAFARDPRGAFAFARDARRALHTLGTVARTLTLTA
jgi:nucleoside phosphorylase